MDCIAGFLFFRHLEAKGKDIPVKVWIGPEDSRE